MNKQTKILLIIFLIIIILLFLNRHNENLNEKEDGEKCKGPTDCKSGKCKEDGTCGYVGNNMKCSNDSECTSRLCSTVTNKCIDPLEDKEKCLRDIECVSDMCLTTVVPNVCSAKLQSDAECKRDDECENKSCINKKCQEKIVDKSVQDCMADMECQSGICNQFTKKCGLNDVNQECHRHKECTTGYCRSKTKKCDNKP